MSDHDNHGLTPTRPRLSVLEANVLEQLRDLREQNRGLVARVEALERKNGSPCHACSHEHEDGSRCGYPLQKAVGGDRFTVVSCGCTS